MRIKNLYLSQKIKFIILSLFLIVILLLPIFSIATNRSKIYVDASVNSSGDGSSSHPYKKIGEALKHAGKKNQVFVRKGTYRENIEIPGGVQVVGADKEKVVIQADEDDRSVVLMNNKSELVKVTVRKGKHGIKINSGDRASINKCVIKDNDQAGIFIMKGSADKDDRVVIKDTKIKNNGKSGIFSDKRKVVLIDNEIYENDGDGIYLSDIATFAWIEDNDIHNNSKSGVVGRLDGSNIFITKSKIHNNKREGIQIESFGRTGYVEIKNSKINNNKNFAVAKVHRANSSKNVWSGMKFIGNNIFQGNGKGAISAIMTIL